MLDKSLKDQVTAVFAGLESEYIFDVFVSKDHESYNELLEMLETKRPRRRNDIECPKRAQQRSCHGGSCDSGSRCFFPVKACKIRRHQTSRSRKGKCCNTQNRCGAKQYKQVYERRQRNKEYF